MRVNALTLLVMLALVGCVGVQTNKTVPPAPTKGNLSQEIMKNLTQNLSENQSKPVHRYTRQNISFLKGAWFSPVKEQDSFSYENLVRLKDAGINVVSIPVVFDLNPDGTVSLIPPGPLPKPSSSFEDIYVQRIRYAHDAGLAVLVELVGVPSKTLETISYERYGPSLIEAARKWSRICEREHVEFFSPLDEPNVVFGGNACIFVENVLPKVRDRFSGNLVAKFADIPPDCNYAGYDYVAANIYWSNDRFNELREHLKKTSVLCSRYVRDYSLKGFFLGEMGAQVEPENGNPAQDLVNESTQAKVHEIFFKELWNSSSGFFVNWCTKGPYCIRGRPAEDVVRGWFSKYHA